MLRKTDATCTKSVVLAMDDGKKLEKELPLDKPVEIAVTFPKAGKDTVNVPQMSMVQFAVRFDAAGRWMYHCHILEHAERGMMGELDVSP